MTSQITRNCEKVFVEKATARSKTYNYELEIVVVRAPARLITKSLYIVQLFLDVLSRNAEELLGMCH